MARCLLVPAIKCACMGYLADVKMKLLKRVSSNMSQDSTGLLQTIILRCYYNVSCGVRFLHFVLLMSLTDGLRQARCCQGDSREPVS